MEKIKKARWVIGVVLAGALGFGIVLFFRASPVKKQPNLVFILLDDLDALITAPYFPEVLPIFNELRQNGVHFSQAYAATPLCCPSRVTILTGKYAHNTGVLNNEGPDGGHQAFLKTQKDHKTIARYLQNAGYQTVALGKYLNGYGESDLSVPEGWSIWNMFSNGTYYGGFNYKMILARDSESPRFESYGASDSDYSTDVLKEKVLRFLEEAKPTIPFFIFLAPTAPHFPIQAPPRFAAQAEKWRGTLPKRPNYYVESQLEGKPGWLQKSWAARRQQKKHSHEFWRKRMGSLYAVNEMIQSIVRTLKATGRWDNTLLVITSDNGFNLGAHGFLGKKNPYEESVRIPLIVAGGHSLGLKRDTTDNHLIVTCDFAPTLLEMAGLSVPREMDGVSFYPLLLGGHESSTWREDILLEYAGDTELARMSQETLMDEEDLAGKPERALQYAVPAYRALRSHVKGQGVDKNFSYIEWLAIDAENQAITHRELYDLETDPFQLDNLLYSRPAQYAGVQKILEARLLKLSQCSGDSCREY